LPNLTHFLVSKSRYGRDLNAGLRMPPTTITAIARAFGLERVFTFRDLNSLERDFPASQNRERPGHTFVVLEVEPFRMPSRNSEQPRSTVRLKFRSGRHVESLPAAIFLVSDFDCRHF